MYEMQSDNSLEFGTDFLNADPTEDDLATLRGKPQLRLTRVCTVRETALQGIARKVVDHTLSARKCVRNLGVGSSAKHRQRERLLNHLALRLSVAPRLMAGVGVEDLPHHVVCAGLPAQAEQKLIE